mmetsp:Transcript_24736/g.72425  ORF Transcript_24736/g.72425 Transcript_24736/m.72425 type:complete len:204 (+) Transcript_24736:201-812(+)
MKPMRPVRIQLEAIAEAEHCAGMNETQSIFCRLRSLLLRLPGFFPLLRQLFLLLLGELLLEQPRPGALRNGSGLRLFRPRLLRRWGRSYLEFLGKRGGDALRAARPAEHLGVAQHSLRDDSSDGRLLHRLLLPLVVHEGRTHRRHDHSGAISNVGRRCYNSQRLVPAHVHLARREGLGRFRLGPDALGFENDADLVLGYIRHC